MNDHAKLLDIVSAAQAGSPLAFAELHAMYSRRLYKTIIAITKHPEDAEDALQDTFLRAYLALKSFEGRSSISSWLTRIAINCALVVLRKRRDRPEMLFDSEHHADSDAITLAVRDSSPNPEEVCDRHQRRLKVLHAIRKLHPHLREPIHMQMTQESSVEEIGRALDISKAAVKTRLLRARRQLSVVRDLKPFVAYRHDSLSAIAKCDAAPPPFDQSRIDQDSDSE